MTDIGGRDSAVERGHEADPQQAAGIEKLYLSNNSSSTAEPSAGGVQQGQPRAQSLPFDGTDLMPGTQQLHPGDEVDFILAHDRLTNEPKATQVRPLKYGSTKVSSFYNLAGAYTDASDSEL